MPRMTLKLTALAVGALAALIPTAAASADPTAGMPHKQRLALCASMVDFGSVSGIELDEESRVLAVEGKPGEDYLYIDQQTNGTSSPWDDKLVVTLTTYGPGADEEENIEVPLYASSGGIGGFTTVNEPKSLYLKRIEYGGSLSDGNAVLNESRVPMRARGWFVKLDTGEKGYAGGSGPDCVEGVTGESDNRDQLIATGGGPDFIRTGFGNDSLSGGDGPDTIVAGEGDDTLRGGSDVDKLQGQGDSDCYSGAQDDGRRDLLDDPSPGLDDFNTYAAEPGEIRGMDVETIEHITEPFPQLVADCVG
jgi:RTX calcium-binding nonapeptide repeat (4 copies)